VPEARACDADFVAQLASALQSCSKACAAAHHAALGRDIALNLAPSVDQLLIVETKL
jgi:hypothetical protein